jgi:glycosyltransferase involved in cell wall biosynthesis
MPLILFVGNLVAVKGVDVLIDALASMGARGKRFNCVIVGEGSLRADLQRRAESKGIAPCVRFVGARPLAELADWYRAADLVVLPSRSEGVPNVLLEASACGAPFVATRVGGVPEIASTGSLVAPDDPIALAERMSSFLESPREPSASSAVGTWEDSARAMAAVLRQVTPDSIRVLKRAA